MSDKFEAVKRDCLRMTLSQLKVAKVNAETNYKHYERECIILNLSIKDKHHPDLLQAEYKMNEAKEILHYIQEPINKKGE